MVLKRVLNICIMQHFRQRKFKKTLKTEEEICETLKQTE